MSSSPARPMPRDAVLKIEAYVPGKSVATFQGKIYKLSSNETPLGPSAQAIAAYQAAANHLELYPDGSSTALRAAIANLYGLDANRIVCGAGSDEILSLLTSAYVGPGDEGIFTTHGFLVYKIAIMAAGGTPVVAPETELTANVDAILAKVSPRTKIVFLANPNNPTGTYIPFDEVRRLQAALPPHVLLVLDAAYAEYVRKNDYSAGMELVSQNDNVVMTRTFSKIYGLAALRIGWCYAPAHVCDAMNRIRGPFNLSSPALAAGVAALQDQTHVAAAVSHNEQWLPRLTQAVQELGINVTPSVGNFLLLHFEDQKGRSAADADLYLSSHGVVVRAVSAYGLPNSLRVTIGSDEANERFIQVLTHFMSSHAHG